MHERFLTCPQTSSLGFYKAQALAWLSGSKAPLMYAMAKFDVGLMWIKFGMVIHPVLMNKAHIVLSDSTQQNILIKKIKILNAL